MAGFEHGSNSRRRVAEYDEESSRDTYSAFYQTLSTCSFDEIRTIHGISEA